MFHRHTHTAECREVQHQAKIRGIQVKSVEFYEEHPEKGEIYLVTTTGGETHLAWFCASGKAIIVKREV